MEATKSRLDELLAGTRPERVAAQEAVLEQLDASLASLDVQLDKSLLAAPFAGTIAKRYFDESTVVSAGSPVLRLIEETQLETWIGVPAAAAAELEVGTEHDILVDGEPFRAVVTAILPELDPVTRSRTVILAIDSAAAKRLVSGQVAQLEVVRTVAESGYWLPITALSRGDRGLWSVLVAKTNAETGDESAERREVEVLYTRTDRTLVRGMLREGDRIILGGTHRVVAGQLLQVK